MSQPDKNVLIWNLCRVEHLLKLAENNLTEVAEMDYRKEAAVPHILPKILTDEQVKEQKENLEEQKLFLSTELGL